MTFAFYLNIVLFVSILYGVLDFTVGHGRMVEPAARNTMWRFNYKNPRNYNDMGLNCGGFPNQFERQGGRCGVCGDPFQGPRDHEAGGKYARGLVARQYRVGSFINITVELTSNHKGYMEFRLCPVNNPRAKVTQGCLDRHLLNIIGHGTRYFITQNGANVFIELLVMLPPNLKCSQCVVQWKWVAGQSMGPDGYGGECMGCGNQEHFINCADIAIGAKPVKPLPKIPDTPGKPAQPAPNPGPAYKAAPVHKAAPTYNVVESRPSSNSAGYSANTVALSQAAYRPKIPAAKPKPTTQPPWNMNMDPTAMLQKMMMGAFGQTDFMMTNQNSWNDPWQQASQNVPMKQSMTQESNLASMFGLLPNMFRESGDWTTDAPPRPHHRPHVTPAPHIHAPGYDASDYAGNEPGEYPEIESPPSHGSSSGGGQGGSSYMQGFNDALRQLGMAGEWNPKASRAVSEITLSLQEKQKDSAPSCPGRVCKATGSWKGQSNLDQWCDTTCKVGQCPSHMCACTCPGAGGFGSIGSCRALDRQKGIAMDKWCTLNCKHNNCPADMCVCY